MARRVGSCSRNSYGASALAFAMVSIASCSDGGSAQPIDGGVDGPSGSCAVADFAGCTTFEDRTAEGADRRVTFRDFEYTPKCMRIRAGQTVVFEGDFDRHPLLTSCGPALSLDKRTGTGPASFVVGAPGRYGYYCLDHGNAGGAVMAGALDVVAP